MSITGRTAGDSCASIPSPCDCTRSPESTGGPRAGATGGGSSGSPTCVRIFRIVSGWVMKLIRRMSPPQFGHASGNSSPTRASSFAPAIREVSWEHGFSSVRSVLSAASRCSPILIPRDCLRPLHVAADVGGNVARHHHSEPGPVTPCCPAQAAGMAVFICDRFPDDSGGFAGSQRPRGLHRGRREMTEPSPSPLLVSFLFSSVSCCRATDPFRKQDLAGRK